MSMEKPPKTPENKEPEYSFEKGIDACLARIRELMKTLNRDILVVINGSGNDVGKTRLLGALQKQLTLLGIDTEHTVFGSEEEEIKKVVFKTAQGLYGLKGESYKDQLEKQGIPGISADLYIGIYRPDKPFELHEILEPVADIMIRNEHAKDDPLKEKEK